MLFFLAIGLTLGHGIRRLCPYLIKLKDTSLPFRWPWLELLCGGLFFWLGHQHGWSLELARWATLFLVLLAMVATDYFRKVIPDSLTLTGLISGLLWSIFAPELLLNLDGVQKLMYTLGLHSQSTFSAPTIAFLGGLSGFLSLEIFRRIMGRLSGMEVMGLGDSFLLAVVGMFLGPILTLFCIIPAALIGLIHGLYYRLVYKQSHLPFGPSLAYGAFIAVYAFKPIMALIDRSYAAFYSLPKELNLVVFLALIVILILLVLRMKRKAAMYSEAIEQEYSDLEKEIKG